MIDLLSLLPPAATGMGAYGAAWIQGRRSRESQAQALFDRIMESVRNENAALHKEVEECKRRDARVLVIETCFRMVVPELLRHDPFNRTIAQVSTLLRGLPIMPNDGEWSDLLSRIDAADEASRGAKP